MPSTFWSSTSRSAMALARSFFSVTATYVGPTGNNTNLPTTVVATGALEQAQIITVRCPGGINDIQVASPGWYVTGNYLTVTALAANYTVDACAVEYPVSSGTWYNVTKGGATSWTVTAGLTNTYSDLTALGINIPDGANYVLYYHLTGTALPQFNSSQTAALYSDEGLNTAPANSTPKYPVTSTDGGQRRQRACGVVAILGTRTGDSVAIIGDSQQSVASSSYISGDQAPSNHNRGDIAATIGGTYAYLNLGIAANQWSTALWSGYAPIAELANKATIVIPAMGINEFNNKNASSAAIALLYPARALPLFKGKKILAATVTPRTTSTSSTTASATLTSITSGILTAGVVTGTILPGMVPSSSGESRIAPYGTGGTTGTGGTGTYSLIYAAGTTPANAGSSTVTFTGAFVAANGSSDQTQASYSSMLPTYNTGLTFSGLLASPLDRYTPVNNATTPNDWYATGAVGYYGTVDGLHLSPYTMYTTMPAQSSTWLAQLAALTPVSPTAPSITMTLTGATFGTAGGHAALVNGTISRNDIFPGNGVFSLILRVVVPATHNTNFVWSTNFTNPFIKTATINASGQVAVINGAGGAAYATSSAINDGAEHEIGIFDDGTTQSLYVDGALVAGASYTHPTNSEPLLSLNASSTSTTAVSIRQVSIWNFVKYTTTYTPALYSGSEAGCIGVWAVATDGTGVLGPVLPQ